MSFVGANRPVLIGDLAEILAKFEQLKAALDGHEPLKHKDIVENCLPKAGE